MDSNKVVVFTGAGISAESGLQTFRDSDGLWYQHRIEDVATPMGWRQDPARVIKFYNDLHQKVLAAQPNAAHLAVARLEAQYDVVVITQNMDDLHERAGSSLVIHLHGQINVVRSSQNESLLYPWLDARPMELGDLCAQGSQLRPHVVWFGEAIQHHDLALMHLVTASKVLVIGTSLQVHPAAGLVKKAASRAQKVMVTQPVDRLPHGYRWVKGRATEQVPMVVEGWLAKAGPCRCCRFGQLDCAA